MIHWGKEKNTRTSVINVCNFKQIYVYWGACSKFFLLLGVWDQKFGDDCIRVHEVRI